MSGLTSLIMAIDIIPGNYASEISSRLSFQSLCFAPSIFTIFGVKLPKVSTKVF